MRRDVGIIGLVLLVVCGGVAAAADDPLTEKCAKEFQKVVACLTYATGKADTPTKECCDAVTSMKDADPACLCYVIEQVHSGNNPQLKNAGIQESRLLQLPSACKIANASITNCPKLLNLPANSPDAAIFTNNATSGAASTATPTTSSSSPGTASPTTTSGGSDGGFKRAPRLAGVPLLASAVAIVFSAIPALLF